MPVLLDHNGKRRCNLFATWGLCLLSRWSANFKKSLACGPFCLRRLESMGTFLPPLQLYPQINVYITPFDSFLLLLLLGLVHCSVKGKCVWPIGVLQTTRTAVKQEHFGVVIGARLPTATTLPCPLECRPQCGWLETWSAEFCISSINLGPRYPPVRAANSGSERRGIGRSWVGAHFTYCYWASVFRGGLMFTEAAALYIKTTNAIDRQVSTQSLCEWWRM